MRRWLVCLIVGLVGCSSASRARQITATTTTPPAAVTAQSPAASTTTTVDFDALGRAYLAAVAPANKALVAFKATPAASTGPEEAKLAAPYIAALHQEETALLAIPVPASMAGDIRALVAAIAAEAGDWQSYAAATILNDSAISSQTIVDETKAQAAANVVRADLHLPSV